MRAGERVSSCAETFGGGGEGFVLENSGVPAGGRERSCGGIIDWEIGGNGCDGIERAGALLRGS